MPHGGMNAVSADENIGFVGQLRTGFCRSLKRARTLPPSCSKSCEPQPGSEIFVTDPFAHSAKQQKLQFVRDGSKSAASDIPLPAPSARRG